MQKEETLCADNGNALIKMETKSTHQLRKVTENQWTALPKNNHTAKDDGWETPAGAYNTWAPPVIPSPQMQKEQYSRADSWVEPVTFENKPIHPLRKVAENP